MREVLIHRNTCNTARGEQRYQPQVQASAESDQVICIRMIRVESYWIDWKVIACLDDICILDYEGIFDCMIKILLALAYPLLVWLLCMLFFYLCDDHQFLDGSICERYSWSTGERWFHCLVFLGSTSCPSWAFFRAMTHVLVRL